MVQNVVGMDIGGELDMAKISCKGIKSIDKRVESKGVMLLYAQRTCLTVAMKTFST